MNVQPLVSDAEDTDGFQGEVSASLTLETGSVDLVLVNTALQLSYQFGVHKLISSSTAELGLTDGTTFMESIFTHLRHQVSILDWLTWETYGQVATDRFRRLSLRGLAGTGPRFNLIDGPAVAFALAASYLFEREMLNERNFSDSGAAYNGHRLSMYLTGKFILNPLLSFIHTTYYQPLLTDPLDFRVSSETNLNVKLTDAIGLSVGFILSYDSRPPEDVSDLDTATRAKITYSF
ncbi:MAG: DUF481 domain-containing protein [Myxococcota bacterium]